MNNNEKKYEENYKRLLAESWKLCQQIVVTEQEGVEPIAWGSGFFMNIEDHLVFVTADHVLHDDCGENGERVDGFTLRIETNIKDTSNGKVLC